MSKPKVVHKQNPSGQCWAGYTLCSFQLAHQITSQKWARVTCKRCIAKRPKKQALMGTDDAAKSRQS